MTIATTTVPRILGRSIHRQRDWKIVFARASGEHDRLSARIGAAMDRGDRRAAEGLQLTYLRSLSAKVVAVFEAAKGFPEKSPADLAQLAMGIDVFKPSDESVVIYAKPKSRGGQRWIYKFGIENKSRQILVANALKPFVAAMIDPRQRAPQYPGRTNGMKAVVAEIDAAFNDGAKWACQLDITGFFPSIGPDLLHRRRKIDFFEALKGGDKKEVGLPLPRDVIDYVVRAEFLNAQITPTRSRYRPYGTCLGPITAMLEARQGIPQGSCCSSLVAEFVVADVIRHLPNFPGISLWTYVDNVFVTTRTKDEVNAISQILKRAFMHSSVGQFTLHSDGIRRACDGFEALGYVIRRRYGRVLTMPSKKNCGHLKKAVLDAVSQLRANNILPFMYLGQAIYRWVKHFHASSENLLSKNVFGWVEKWVRARFGFSDIFMRSKKAVDCLQFIGSAEDYCRRRWRPKPDMLQPVA